MKNILFLLCFLFYGLSTIAQTDKKWLFSMDFGIQEHDKRLYHWPKIPRENLLAMQPENYGTYQVGISISKKVIDQKKFSTYAGTGLSIEMATFNRPFDQNYNKGPGTNEGKFTDEYYQYLLQFPISSKYEFLKNCRLTLDLLPQINFYTIAAHYIDPSITWWQFSLYSIELNPGIEYEVGKFNFGIKYRAFQTKKIDPILFYSSSSYIMGDEKYETFNPFKLWFSIGYRL